MAKNRHRWKIQLGAALASLFGAAICDALEEGNPELLKFYRYEE